MELIRNKNHFRCISLPVEEVTRNTDRFRVTDLLFSPSLSPGPRLLFCAQNQPRNGSSTLLSRTQIFERTLHWSPRILQYEMPDHSDDFMYRFPELMSLLECETDLSFGSLHPVDNIRPQVLLVPKESPHPWPCFVDSVNGLVDLRINMVDEPLKLRRMVENRGVAQSFVHNSGNIATVG
ncbi:hypothetical protein BC567DRAFT_214070 [Phyllosticta citribraziliensis]